MGKLGDVLLALRPTVILRPTITPSILAGWHVQRLCHSRLRPMPRTTRSILKIAVCPFRTLLKRFRLTPSLPSTTLRASLVNKPTQTKLFLTIFEADAESGHAVIENYPIHEVVKDDQDSQTEYKTLFNLLWSRCHVAGSKRRNANLCVWWRIDWSRTLWRLIYLRGIDRNGINASICFLQLILRLCPQRVCTRNCQSSYCLDGCLIRGNRRFKLF